MLCEDTFQNVIKLH